MFEGLTRLAAVGFCLAASAAAADPAVNDIPLTAYEACVTADDDRVRIDRVSANGDFVTANGEKFTPADIQYPKGARTGGALWNSRKLEGRLEAVRIGPANRWGVAPAWVILDDEMGRHLLQMRDLENGDAIFAPRHASGSCAGFLRLAETVARKAGRNIWNSESEPLIFATSEPGTLETAVGRYVIATGRIVSLGKTRSTRYLNFGTYWKTDFTVTLKPSDEDTINDHLAGSGLKVETLAGHEVELRGIVQLKDGPTIRLSHPGQLEVIEDKRVARGGQDGN